MPPTSSPSTCLWTHLPQPLSCHDGDNIFLQKAFLSLYALMTSQQRVITCATYPYCLPQSEPLLPKVPVASGEPAGSTPVFWLVASQGLCSM